MCVAHHRLMARGFIRALKDEIRNRLSALRCLFRVNRIGSATSGTGPLMPRRPTFQHFGIGFDTSVGRIPKRVPRSPDRTGGSEQHHAAVRLSRRTPAWESCLLDSRSMPSRRVATRQPGNWLKSLTWLGSSVFVNQHDRDHALGDHWVRRIGGVAS